MPLPYSLTVRPGHVSLMCHSCVLHCVDISAGEHFLQVLGFFEVFTCLFKCQCSNWLTKSSQSLQLHLLYLPAQYFSTPLVLTQWIVILVLAELTCEHLDKISVFFFFLSIMLFHSLCSRHGSCFITFALINIRYMHMAIYNTNDHQLCTSHNFCFL